jgi:pimeloyl-ACP methyl ester carboxylesterase
MRVTAAEWFAGGQRIPYDPESARVLTEEEVAATPGGLRVFERVAAAEQDADEDTVWLTMLPGFPDGSYGWAQVDRILGAGLRPRLYVEPVGQGDSDKPRDYPYSTVERADLVEALWRHHGVRRTVVVTFDYTSLALLEILTFPGGHLTTSEHPDLLAAAIRDIAARHGVGTAATATATANR